MRSLFLKATPSRPFRKSGEASAVVGTPVRFFIVLERSLSGVIASHGFENRCPDWQGRPYIQGITNMPGHSQRRDGNYIPATLLNPKELPLFAPHTLVN